MFKPRNLETKLLILADLITINSCTFLLFFIKFKSGWFPIYSVQSYSLLLYAMPAIYLFWFAIFWSRNLYRSFYYRNIIEILVNIIGATFIGVLLIFIIIDLTDQSISFEKKGLMIYLLIFITFTGGARFVFKLIQTAMLKNGIGLRNAVIIGNNPIGNKLYKEYKKGNLLGIYILGFLDDSNSDKKHYLGKLADLETLLQRDKIREVLIALPPEENIAINKVILTCKNYPVSFKIEPSLTDIISGNIKTCEILGYPLMELFPEILTPFQTLVKRSVDIVMALTILTLTAPLMLITAIIIRIESSGKVIYTQKRVGKDFKEFTVYKFRSMCSNAEAKTGAVWASKNDSRITRVGKFIRKTRIDELPQLFNIIIGNMSFVGPRPERKVFVDQFVETIPFYYKRLQVKPGLTGWAQVKHKYDESFDDVKEKLKYDLFYIENMSLQLDFIIILNTVSVVVMQKGQ